MRALIERKTGYSSKMDWEGWKLYEPESAKEETKVANASAALNDAMSKFRKELKKRLAKVSEYDTKVIGPIAGGLYDSIVLPVHRKFKSIGANDTPVREVSTVAAIQMVKDIYGKTRWTKLGDYIG